MIVIVFNDEKSGGVMIVLEVTHSRCTPDLEGRIMCSPGCDNRAYLSME